MESVTTLGLTYVARVLMAMGERGLPEQFSAMLAGRAKARSLDAARRPDERAQYRNQQREAFAGAMADYNPDAVLVLDVDLGHTDPQLVIPPGGTVRVDPQRRRITVTY